MHYRIKENINWLIDTDERTNRNVAKASELIGVNQTTLHRITKGETESPRLDVLGSVAQFFEISISQLVGEHPLPGRDLEDNPGEYNVIVNQSPVRYEIKADYLGKAIDMLKEDVEDWCNKPTINQSRLLMMYYDKIKQENE